MSDTMSSRLSAITAGLFFFAALCLMAPLGLLFADAVADTQVVTTSAVATDATSDRVAATAAEFRVDESGAATYSIPIYTVPGTAGVAPELTLSYSSQGGYGPLGKGWSIGGLSSITRCRATREAGDFIVNGTPVNGNPRPINYTSSDRYCLDGQRLLPGAGGASCQAVSGMSVQTLRTEIESFQRVCAYTPTGSGNGPAFFTVERKDGSTSWYGDRVTSTATQNLGYNGYVKSTAPGKTARALSWLQTRLQDSTGNYIDYVYTVPAAGEHLISYIRYTGKTVLPGQSGSAKTPFARIQFHYSARAAADVSKGYASGGVLTQSRRLNSITVCAANTSSCAVANQARHYKLTYATSASGSKRQNLTRVQECRDSSSAGICLPSTTFTWSAGRNEFATAEKPASLSPSTDHIRGFKTADINGDGRQDIALLYLAGSGCVGGTWVVTATSTLAGSTPTFQNAKFNCVPTKIVDRGDGAWHLFDYNGDGRDDLFVSSATGAGWKVHPSNGTGFNMSTNLISGLSPAIPSVDDKNDQVQLADLNGDGLMDIVYPRDNKLKARVMRRSGSNFAWGGERDVVADNSTFPPFNDPRCSQTGYLCYRNIVGAPSPKTGFTQLADFNGDAASDLLLQVQDTIWWNEDCTCPPGEICDDPRVAGSAPVGNPLDSEAITVYRTGRAEADRALQVTASTCGEHWETRTRLHLMTVRSATSSKITVDSYADLPGNPNAISLADANGDGLTDLFYQQADKKPWRYRINTGTGMQAAVQLPASSSADYEELVRFADVNGDGRADVLRVAGSYKNYYAMLALPGGGFAGQTAILGGKASICGNTSCDQRKRSPMFMDLDGDGQLDFLSIDYSSGNLGLYISRARSRFQPRDTITKITNGLGAQTDITYAPLTNAAVYRRDTGSRSLNWGRGAPVQDLLAPNYVVARAASSSPQAGNPNAKATVHYRYAGAKVQAGGRGFLGFREIATVDTNHDSGYVTTTSSYHQNFPYIGMPARTIKRAVASGSYSIPACLNGTINNTCFATPGQAFPTMPGNWFSDSSQVWEADTVIGTGVRGYVPGEQRPVHVRTAGTEEKLRDPSTGSRTSRVVTTFDYTSYGNVSSTTVDTFNGTSSTVLSSVITSNVYSNNGTPWRLGRLSSSTVTHQRYNRPDVVRKATFAYSKGGPYTGLLTAERSQSGQGANQDLRKEYTYDEYGNKTVVETCADPATSCSTSITFRPSTPTKIQRYSRTAYDSRGRYPVKTVEPFWSGTGGVERITQTVVSRNLFGDVTEARDVNGATTLAETGALGRPYYTWTQTVPGATPGDPDGGVETLTTYRWCGTSSGQVSCPAGAKFRQEESATGAPRAWTYFDVLGRPVMKATQTFNIGKSGKDVSAVCTAYNAAGQPKRVSNPFFLGGTSGSNGPSVASGVCTSSGRNWMVTHYDVLGRVTDVVAADGSITSTDYANRRTLVTDGRGNMTNQLRNALGELVEVTDANGLKTTYSYFADGSLYRTSRDAGRGIIHNLFYYDSAGRKIRQVDPDSGTTHFEYNALGELTAQQDAEGNRIENEIDARGRVWRKTVKRANGVVESRSTFEHDTRKPGQLTRESITGTYAGWAGQSGMGLAFSRGYTYDALGRPVTSNTVIDGVSYGTETRYDALGRAWKSKDASGRWTKTQFNARGFVYALCDSSAAATLPNCPGDKRTHLQVSEADAWGNVIREQRGYSAALRVARSYHVKSGRISSICGGNSNCSLMNEQYAWDAAGNLHTQRKESRYLETFTYDALNRLVSSKLAMQDGIAVDKYTLWHQYDALGNICHRRGLPYGYEGRAGCGSTTTYGSGGTGTTGPHRVGKTTDGNGNDTFYYYDSRGNQTVRDAPGTNKDRTIRYSLDNRAHEIAVSNGNRTRYWYGPGGQRYKREDQNGKRTLYLGNVEIVVQGGTTTYKRNIGGVVLQTVQGGSATNHYLFHDHLGSLARIADVDGKVINTQDYRSFGERRSGTDPTKFGTAPALTPRGFTGHEHVDGAGMSVIHMNGRIYDQTLGRFLQPDPVIEAPANPQTWNAYTYVRNNPLAYTDPTGMFSWKKTLGVVVAVVGSIVAPYLTPIFGKLGTAMIVGAAAGAASTGNLQGALYGALSGALFYGVGSYFENAQWAQASEWNNAFDSGLNWGGYGTKALAHGATGGVMSKLQGGHFGHAFASAGVTQVFSPAINTIGDGASNYAGARVAAAAVLGGTASKLSGGKFANGAVTAAFSRAFNEESHYSEKHPKDWSDDDWRAWRSDQAVDIFAPFTGPFGATYDLYQSWLSGDSLGMGLSAVGFIPAGRFVGSAGKFVGWGRTANQYRHTFRHLKRSGFSQGDVINIKGAINSDISSAVSRGGLRVGNNNRVIMYNGVRIDFNARVFQNGNVAVQRITPPKGYVHE